MMLYLIFAIYIDSGFKRN